jgi:hypothetical protein
MNVNLRSVLSSHFQRVAQRFASEPVVLAVQAATTIDYPSGIDWGEFMSGEPEPARRVLAHSTLAFDRAGTPLGLVDAQCWAREAAKRDESGKPRWRGEWPPEAKANGRWRRSLEAVEKVQAACPRTRVISVGDREADIYDLFVWAQAKPGRPGVLARVGRERLLREGQGPLWTLVASQAVAGQFEVQVPGQASRLARAAVLEVRFAAVELRAPTRQPNLPPVPLWAVLARELGASPGVLPLEWMLLSTEPVGDFEAAVERLRWYVPMWDLEAFHRALKAGCQDERRRDREDGLEACLGHDLVMGWRVYQLIKLGRGNPDVPVSVGFEEGEWQALVAFRTNNLELPKKPPTLHEAVRMVAGLAGWFVRYRDDEPGARSVWHGMERLGNITQAFELGRSMAEQGTESGADGEG